MVGGPCYYSFLEVEALVANHQSAATLCLFDMWDALTFGTWREAPHETVQVICLLVMVCSYNATFIETTVSLPRNAQRLQVLKAVALPFRIDCRGGTASGPVMMAQQLQHFLLSYLLFHSHCYIFHMVKITSVYFVFP